MSTLARTLEAVDILQKHNFTKQEAQKVIDIMQGVSATKEDLLKAETRLKEEMHNLDKKIDSVKAELKEDISLVKAELKEDMHALDKKIDFLQADFKWIKATSVGILLILFGQILAMVFSLK